MRTFVFLALAAIGCGTAEGPDNTQSNANAVVGTWISTGADLARGFVGAPFNFKTLVATFNADGSYAVEATDAKDATIDFSGTWTATRSTVDGIFDVEQRQSVPQNVVSRGMYRIDGARMTFELIQVQPDVGALPPAAGEGFGSTTVKGTRTDAWIQKYVRM